MEAEDILQESGLSGNESKIYLALLKLGPSLAGKIADETKLNRTHVYDRLRHLLEKGTVSYTIQSGKKYFTAAHPNKLLETMQEKEARLQEIIPSLSKIEKNDNVEIEVYRGKEGLKTILQDYL